VVRDVTNRVIKNTKVCESKVSYQIYYSSCFERNRCSKRF